MGGPSSPFPSAEAAIAAAKACERDGELLEANEIAYDAALAFPESRELKYLAVRTLARTGGTEEAKKLYGDWRLDQGPDEDALALGGRLEKDSALRHSGPARTVRLRAAAKAYEKAHGATGGSFSGVNAATLWFLAGERARAATLIAPVRAACLAGRSNEPLDRYYHHATLAELALLAGEEDEAHRQLETAAALAVGDLAAHATTRRQLALICEARGLDAGWLEVLHIPAVVHYLGHRILPPGETGRFEAREEADVAAGIARWIERHDARFFYGALASGADILFAEAALARPDGELHVVLPFAAAEFREVSVRSSGAAWLDRFDSCLAAAGKRVTIASEAGWHGEELLFTYGTRLAMGLARLHAERLGVVARQAAVWDRQPAAGAAGTAIDIAGWQAAGGLTDVIDLPGAATIVATDKTATSSRPPRRAVRAILHGDFEGFSKLDEEAVVRLSERAMAAIGAVAGEFGSAIDHRNSWGDAIFLTFEDVAVAARCALAVQRRLAGLDGAGEPRMHLRLAGHVGLAWRSHDPIRDEPAWIGREIVRAARLQGAATPGQVYVTEPFAAALALADAPDLRCEFIGTRQSDKGFGEMRMYRLISQLD